MKENKLIKKILIEVLEFSKIFFFALLISSLIKSTVVANAIVPTGSMEETVMTGSRILINRLAYVTDEPQRGDIVSFHYPDHEEELFLKRVMGLPGETIEGISGYIYRQLFIKVTLNSICPLRGSTFSPQEIPLVRACFCHFS